MFYLYNTYLRLNVHVVAVFEQFYFCSYVIKSDFVIRFVLVKSLCSSKMITFCRIINLNTLRAMYLNRVVCAVIFSEILFINYVIL